jgi:hypothetical protein
MQVNGGIQNSVLQILDEEKGELWKPAFNYGYQNRGVQSIAWQWGPINSWPSSGFMSGDPSVPLTVFGGDARETDMYGPWNLGISGKSRPFFIRGICKDGAGNPLGGAVVYAVRVSDNVQVSSASCDDRGVFECPTQDQAQYFVHSFYASGSLAGRSVATLTPTL